MAENDDFIPDKPVTQLNDDFIPDTPPQSTPSMLMPESSTDKALKQGFGSTVSLNDNVVKNKETGEDADMSAIAREFGFVDMREGMATDKTATETSFYTDMTQLTKNLVTNVFAIPSWGMKNIIRVPAAIQTIVGGMKPDDMEKFTKQDMELVGKAINSVGLLSGALFEYLNRAGTDKPMDGKAFCDEIGKSFREDKTLGQSMEEALMSQYGFSKDSAAGMVTGIVGQCIDLFTTVKTLKLVPVDKINIGVTKYTADMPGFKGAAQSLIPVVGQYKMAESAANVVMKDAISDISKMKDTNQVIGRVQVLDKMAKDAEFNEAIKAGVTKEQIADKEVIKATEEVTAKSLILASLQENSIKSIMDIQAGKQMFGEDIGGTEPFKAAKEAKYESPWSNVKRSEAEPANYSFEGKPRIKNSEQRFNLETDIAKAEEVLGKNATKEQVKRAAGKGGVDVGIMTPELAYDLNRMQQEVNKMAENACKTSNGALPTDVKRANMWLNAEKEVMRTEFDLSKDNPKLPGGALESATKSLYSRMERLGDKGVVLSKGVKDIHMKQDQYSGKYSEGVIKSGANKLNLNERELLGDYLNDSRSFEIAGRVLPEKIQKVYDVIRKSYDAIIAEGIKRGYKVKLADGSERDLYKMNDYGSRIYDYDTFRPGGKNRAAAIERISIKDSIDKVLAEKRLDTIIENSENIGDTSVRNGALHNAREYDLPGWEKDSIVAWSHYVTRAAKEFATEDVFGKDGAMGKQIVDELASKYKTSEIEAMYRRSMGELTPHEQLTMRAASVVKNYETASKMMMAGIGNINQFAVPLARFHIKNAIELAFKGNRVLKENGMTNEQFMSETGAAMHTSMQALSRGKFSFAEQASKVQGIKDFRGMGKFLSEMTKAGAGKLLDITQFYRTENLISEFSANMAVMHADSLLKVMAKNALSVEEASALSRIKANSPALMALDPIELVKLKELSSVAEQKQIAFTKAKQGIQEFGIDPVKAMQNGKYSLQEIKDIGTRGSKLGATRVEPGDLPLWTTSAPGSIIFQFKTFGYKYTADMIDLMMKDPKAATRMAMYTGAGTYIVNIIRKLITKQELSFTEKNDYKTWVSYITAMTCGPIFQSTFNSALYGERALYSTIGGPTIQDAVTMVTEPAKATKQLAEGKPGQSVKTIGRKIVKTVIPPVQIEKAIEYKTGLTQEKKK